MMEQSRIIHAAVRGLAPKQTADTFDDTIHQSVFFDRHNHVRRAGGFKPTASADVHRGKRFITKHHADGETF